MYWQCHCLLNWIPNRWPWHMSPPNSSNIIYHLIKVRTGVNLYFANFSCSTNRKYLIKPVEPLWAMKEVNRSNQVKGRATHHSTTLPPLNLLLRLLPQEPYSRDLCVSILENLCRDSHSRIPQTPEEIFLLQTRAWPQGPYWDAVLSDPDGCWQQLAVRDFLVERWEHLLDTWL